MQIVIGNSYCGIVGDIPQDLNAVLANTLSYTEKSDAYRRHKVKERFGYYPPAKVIYVYDFKTQKFPTGLLHDVITIYKKLGYEYELKDLRKRPEPYLGLPWNNPHDLRDYQLEAVEAGVRSGRGRIEAATGSGKALIYMKIIQKLGVRTLLVCSTVGSLDDMYTEAKTCFPEGLLGRVGGGFKKHGSAITMITNASFAKLSKEVLNEYEAIIVDEAHHIGGGMLQAIYAMDCYYKFGGSGTQFRTDGSSILLQAATGRLLARVKTKQLQENGRLSKAHITFVETDTKYISSKLFSDFIEIYDATVVNNEDRNNLILKILKKHLGQQVLILSSRIEHGKALYEEVKRLDPTAIQLDGTTPKKERSANKDAFGRGEVHTCVASSLPKYETILVKNKGIVKLMRMDEIYQEYAPGEFEVLSYNKLTGLSELRSITNVHKHPIEDLKMLEVVCGRDIIEVTHNHSLVNEFGLEVKPSIGGSVATPLLDTSIFREDVMEIDLLETIKGNEVYFCAEGLSRRDMQFRRKDEEFLKTGSTAAKDKRPLEKAKKRLSDPLYALVKPVVYKYLKYDHMSRFICKVDEIRGAGHIIEKMYPTYIYNRRSRDEKRFGTTLKITPELCKVLGFFYGDGSMGKYTYARGSGYTDVYTVTFSCYDETVKANRDVYKTEYISALLDKVFPGFFVKIPKGYRSGSRLMYAILEGLRLYDDDGEKRVPDFIYNTSKENRVAFIEGVVISDGHFKKDGNTVSVSTTSKVGLRGLATILKSIACEVTVSFNDSKAGSVWGSNDTRIKRRYVLTFGRSLFDDCPEYKPKIHTGLDSKMRQISEIDYKGDVYDISVDGNENFVSGTGVVAHNSIFDESINLPNLQVMIVASAGKSGISVIQRLGRILRKTETKNEAWMYDMYDTHNDKLHKQSLARINELKKEGHTVKIIKENDL